MDQKEFLHMYEEEERHWWYVGMREIMLSFLPPFSLPANPLILDAGCGSGFNIGWFRRHYGATVIAFDFSPYGLHFCRRRGETCLVRADAARLPFTEAFDLAASFDVLTHLKDEAARTAALNEFYRVLKPGGRLLLRVAAYEWLRSSHDAEIKTWHRYGKTELRHAVENAGFEVLRLTGANTVLFPLAVLWRMLKKVGLASAGSDVRSNTRGSDQLNRLMTSILRLEASALRRSSFHFSFGLSILLLARKSI
jgi:SAM-dependent methyltransferase